MEPTASSAADPGSGTVDFLHATLGRTGRRVLRLGLAGNFLREDTIRMGIDAGMNYLFWYPWDRPITKVVRQMPPSRRDELVLASGAGNLGHWVLRHALETCLRKAGTDHIDVFHCIWVGAGNFDPATRELLERFRQEGKIRYIAISTHARKYAAALVRENALDVLMMRYNAAHRGAEEDIFPYLAASRPGIVSYTATRWGKLLQAPRGWPVTERVPSAGDCYRFVLSNPCVNVCLTAPGSKEQLAQNLAALERGPMAPDELEFMRRFGDIVHAQGRWFF